MKQAANRQVPGPQDSDSPLGCRDATNDTTHVQHAIAQSSQPLEGARLTQDHVWTPLGIAAGARTAVPSPSPAAPGCNATTLPNVADGGSEDLTATRVHLSHNAMVAESGNSGTKVIPVASRDDVPFALSTPATRQWKQGGDGNTPQIRGGSVSTSSVLTRGGLHPSTPLSGPFGSPRSIRRGMAGMLRDELTCPICFEPYRLPVTIPCGHTFCRYCIAYGRSCTEACPLCRTPLGNMLNINMVLHNLIKAMGFNRTGSFAPTPTAQRKHLPQRSKTATAAMPGDNSAGGDLDDTATVPSPYVVSKSWWSEKLDKPTVPLQVFLRVLMHEIGGDPNSLFFDDLHCCCADLLSTRELWNPVKWMIGFESGLAIANACGLAFDNDVENQDSLRTWVEEYVQNKPHTIAENTMFEPSFPGLQLQVLPDDVHGIHAKNVEGRNIMNKLPWAAGRHSECLVHLPHSSCSLFHFMVLPMAPSEMPLGVPPMGLGVVDLQSSIGTMIRVQQESDVYPGEVVHITYYLEMVVTILTWEESLRLYADGETGFVHEGTKVRVWNVPDKKVATLPIERVLDSNGKCNLDLAEYQPVPLLKLSHIKPNGPSGGDSNSPPTNDIPLPDFWIIDPLGTAVGRGPALSPPYKLKLVVTETNYYVSREHAIFFYGKRSNSAVPAWVLRDASSLGTFRKLRPFTDKVPLFPGQVFKIGQCKVEVSVPHSPVPPLGIALPGMYQGGGSLITHPMTGGGAVIAAGPIRHGAEAANQGDNRLSRNVVPSLLGYHPAPGGVGGTLHTNAHNPPPGAAMPGWAQPHNVALNLAPHTVASVGILQPEGAGTLLPPSQSGSAISGGATGSNGLSQPTTVFPREVTFHPTTGTLGDRGGSESAALHGTASGGALHRPTFAGILAATGSNAASTTSTPTRFSVPAPRMLQAVAAQVQHPPSPITPAGRQQLHHQPCNSHLQPAVAVHLPSNVTNATALTTGGATNIGVGSANNALSISGVIPGPSAPTSVGGSSMPFLPPVPILQGASPTRGAVTSSHNSQRVMQAAPGGRSMVGETATAGSTMTNMVASISPAVMPWPMPTTTTYMRGPPAGWTDGGPQGNIGAAAASSVPTARLAVTTAANAVGIVAAGQAAAFMSTAQHGGAVAIGGATMFPGMTVRQQPHRAPLMPATNAGRIQ